MDLDQAFHSYWFWHLHSIEFHDHHTQPFANFPGGRQLFLLILSVAQKYLLFTNNKIVIYLAWSINANFAISYAEREYSLILANCFIEWNTRFMQVLETSHKPQSWLGSGNHGHTGNIKQGRWITGIYRNKWQGHTVQYNNIHLHAFWKAD